MRFAILTSIDTKVLQFMARDLAWGMKKAGHEMEVVMEGSRWTCGEMDDLTRDDVEQMLDEYHPDAIVQFIAYRYSLDFPIDWGDRIFVSWITDPHPRVWDRAVIAGRKDDTQRRLNWADFALMLSQPHVPLLGAYNLATDRADAQKTGRQTEGALQTAQPGALLPITATIGKLASMFGLDPTGIYNPEAAYKVKYEKELDTWKEEQLAKVKANGMQNMIHISKGFMLFVLFIIERPNTAKTQPCD